MPPTCLTSSFGLGVAHTHTHNETAGTFGLEKLLSIIEMQDQKVGLMDEENEKLMNKVKEYDYEAIVFEGNKREKREY